MNENKSITNNGRDASSGRFITGNNGGGRPRGARNRLSEVFLENLLSEWERSGQEALRKCATDEPAQFCKIVANLMPAKIDQTLTVDVDLFQSAQSFHEAWQLAKETLGIDHDPLLIEAKRNNGR
jgi:hypothetical protein